MRSLFTTKQFLVRPGHTYETLRWQLHTGETVQAYHGVYLAGPEPPTRLEFAVASAFGSTRTARAFVAATIHDLDGLSLELPEVVRVQAKAVGGRPVRRFGVNVANGLQTVIDLAPRVDDVTWEMLNESAMHKRLFKLHQFEALLPVLTKGRVPGTARIKRVLALRPPGAPPTESALETLMVQLIRTAPEIPEPTRQRNVYDRFGIFVARVDLCWPELGIFLELDGEGHKGQPVYDAVRQTNVVSATGWLPGRFTWTGVNYQADAVRQQLRELFARARVRPLSSTKLG